MIKLCYYSIAFLFLSGLLIIFGEDISKDLKTFQNRHRLKKYKNSFSFTKEEELPSKFSQMLYLSFGLKGENTVLYFCLVSLFLGLLAGIPLWANFGAGLGLYALISVSLLPYLLMRTKLRNQQVDMSKEGEQLLTEILNNYRIYHYSMNEAIEKTSFSIENAPLSKKRLLDLSRELNSALGEIEIRKAINKFRFSLETSWGDLLATNMEFAVIDGIIVTESLKDLLANVIEARKHLEQTKRETNDSGIVLKYLFPVMCLIIYFGATLCFGMSSSEFLHNQFKTRLGLTWFIGMTFSYFISLLISAFFARSKMDL